MATKYTIGTALTLIASFKDVDGDFADPTTVTFKVMDPEGTVTPYVYGEDVRVINDSVGIYHLTIEPATAGPFQWRVEGVGGDVDTAGEESFTIDAGKFAA